MACLNERLVALSGEAEAESKPERGVWLSEKLEEFKRSEGITEDTEPTIELIKLQVCLPKFKTEQDRLDFKEPIRQWEEVTGQKGLLPPSWDRSILPEVEILERPPPPQVDNMEFRIGKWIQAAPIIVKEEIFNNNVEIKIPKKEEVLNNDDLDDSAEVTVLDGSCVIRYAMLDTLEEYFSCESYYKALETQQPLPFTALISLCSVLPREP